MNNYKRNLMRLRGFCDGAGARALNPKHESDLDYQKGYGDGQRSKHAYAEESAKELGVMVREIVPLPLAMAHPTLKQFLALPMETRREILEKQCTPEMVKYYEGIADEL